MSWIVNTLLKNRLSIREIADTNSDELNDLFLIEKAIEEMHNYELLSDFDVMLLSRIGDGKMLKDLSKEFSIGKGTLSKTINQLCERISFYLGGPFTNDGYLTELAEHNNLTDDQVETLKRYIESKFKHTIIRSPYKDEG
jgi:hypothetical protein